MWSTSVCFHSAYQQVRSRTIRSLNALTVIVVTDHAVWLFEHARASPVSFLPDDFVVAEFEMLPQYYYE